MGLELLLALEIRRLLQKLVAYLIDEFVQDTFGLIKILKMIKCTFNHFAFDLGLRRLVLFCFLEVGEQFDQGSGELRAASIQRGLLMQLG